MILFHSGDSLGNIETLVALTNLLLNISHITLGSE